MEVEVSGGGSGVGLAALIKGAVDLANSSRDIKPGEVELALKSTGQRPKGVIVGFDALAVFVHKDNPIAEISFEQLARVFAESGSARRWSDLGVSIPGVSDDRIVRVSRQSSSGTYEFFRERTLGNEDFRLGSLDLNGSKEVVELVGSTPTAIGYSGMGYATPGVKMLRVARAAGEPAVAPAAGWPAVAPRAGWPESIVTHWPAAVNSGSASRASSNCSSARPRCSTCVSK